ncbi:hypothetical protein LCGC14_2482890, partial [marine sediment metagenome]
MNLEKIEKKFRAGFRLGTPRECGSSGFILSDGSVIATTDHNAACKTIGCKLSKVLEVGVCRFLFRIGQQGNVAVFEYRNLTPEQKIIIRKMLKNDDYFTVVTEKTTTNS